MSGSLSSAEGELNAIVKEYLEHLKLSDTLQAFEEECRTKGKPIEDHAGNNRRDSKILKIQNELLTYFDAGKRSNFFSSWESHINCDLIETDQSYQKLEFIIHVHFAVFPLRKTDHWAQEEVEEAMFHFRYYLDTRGSYLSNCPELLPFFGLPYVKCPTAHPSFGDIFKESWISEQRKKVEAFIWDHLKKRWQQDLPVPRLIELYNKNDFRVKELQNELKQMESRLGGSERCYISQTKKMDKLQEDCQQLMSVASLLVTALESAVKGNIVDLDCVLSSCTERFPDIYKLNGRIYKNKEEKPLKQKSSVESSSPYKNKLPTSDFSLDYKKIKAKLCGSEERVQVLLLQALRWRLTKTEPLQAKQREVLLFIDNDILDLRASEPTQQKVLSILKTQSIVLQQSISRFLNAFASFSKGREYLSQSSDLLQCLVDSLLVSKTEDVITRDMTLGTLQKLSTRSAGQNFMINASMMEWLTDLLFKPKELTDYGLEYSTALLMNLCLCPNGRKRCEQIKEKILLVLSALLELERTNIIGYVNGALYSILSVPAVKEYASKQNLEDTLVIIMNKSDPEIKKQLECIQELLHTSSGESESCTSEEEDETSNEEETDLEIELDLDDPVVNSPGEASGEFLLWKEYSLSGRKVEGVFSSDAKRNRKPQHLKVAEAGSERHSGRKKSSGRTSRASVLRSNSVPPDAQQSSLLPKNTGRADPAGGGGGGHASSEPVTPKLDVEATQLVRKIVGQPSTTLVEAAVAPNPASVNIKGLNVNEYMVAFSSRPKIPRTPEMSPTGRNHSNATPVKETVHMYDAYDSEGHDFCRMSPKVAACSPPM